MFQGNSIGMVPRALAAIAVLGLAACQSEADTEGTEAEATEMPADHAEGQTPAAGQMEAPHGQVSVLMYECADGGAFALTVAPGVAKAALRFDEGVFQLDQQEVASGMEFSDGTYTFRGQGAEGYVEKDGEEIFSDCKATGHPGAEAMEAETPES
jgi:membrane-bound inhibitor of C-type lysozyme